ncbi:ribulose phosphate epimerase [Nannocystaceae bacterium ST9]
MITACSSDDASQVDDEAGSTTNPGSGSETTSTSTSTSTTDSGSESTQSEGTDTDDSVDSLDERGLSFYAGPDYDEAVPECDPFAQDCPDGEKCVPYSTREGGTWDFNKCVPVLGDGEPGDPCVWAGAVDATDDCGASSICWNATEVEGQLVGTCAPLCGGTALEPICAPGTTCLITNDASITICQPTCDPLAQDCGEGLGCYWLFPDFFCIFTAAVNLSIGEPCHHLNDCTPGNTCVDLFELPGCDGACCTSWCDLSDPVCSLAQTECVAFFDVGEAPAGLEQLGVCALP